jgi:hypothetical protein
VTFPFLSRLESDVLPFLRAAALFFHYYTGEGISYRFIPVYSCLVKWLLLYFGIFRIDASADLLTRPNILLG